MMAFLSTAPTRPSLLTVCSLWLPPESLPFAAIKGGGGGLDENAATVAPIPARIGTPAVAATTGAAAADILVPAGAIIDV